MSVKLGTICGANTIVMSPTHDLNRQMLIIDTGAADLTLTIDVSPASLSVPAGYGRFLFNYTLTDSFGNPGEGQPIRVDTSVGETMLFYTDYTGKTPDLVYGPKSEIGPVNNHRNCGECTEHVTACDRCEFCCANATGFDAFRHAI